MGERPVELDEVRENMFLPLPGVPPILITRTEGVYLYDSSGGLEELPMVGDIRGKGLLRSIEFVKDKGTKEPLPKDKRLKMDMITTCLLKGVFFYPGYWEDEQGRGDHIMIAPPFIITEEQIDECIRVLRETIEELQNLHGIG